MGTVSVQHLNQVLVPVGEALNKAMRSVMASEGGLAPDYAVQLATAALVSVLVQYLAEMVRAEGGIVDWEGVLSNIRGYLEQARHEFLDEGTAH